MAKIISEKLYNQIQKILEGLVDSTKGDQKAKLSGMFSEFSNAETASGYSD